MDSVIFTVGSRHENRKGPYEVLSIDAERMVIRWDSGETATTDVKGQLKVLRNMARELSDAHAQPRKGVPSWFGTLFKGLIESDFNDDVTGTRWRSREQLGGAVTALIPGGGLTLNSWGIYKRPEVHWADVSHRREEHASLQAKFVTTLSSAGLEAGFYIERPGADTPTGEDWKNFLSWLKESGGEAVLADVMRTHALVMKDPKQADDRCFDGTIQSSEAGWAVQTDRALTTRLENLARFLEALRPDRWLDLVITKQIPASQAIERGVAIASDIAAIFAALLPAYEASIGTR